MGIIKGIQHTARRSNAILPYTDRDWRINCDEFVVERELVGKRIGIKVFFPLSSAPQTGVGLLFESPKAAVAVARTLLSVAEGCASEIRGHFTE
jgi:hypothetical protein